MVTEVRVMFQGRCFGGCMGTEMAVLFRGGGGDTGIDCVMGDEGRDGGLIGIERY